jgi:hypothetical protein
VIFNHATVNPLVLSVSTLTEIITTNHHTLSKCRISLIKGETLARDGFRGIGVWDVGGSNAPK